MVGVFCIVRVKVEIVEYNNISIARDSCKYESLGSSFVEEFGGNFFRGRLWFLTPLRKVFLALNTFVDLYSALFFLHSYSKNLVL